MKATNYFAKRPPLWVALASALVAALMLLFVSFEGAQSARAADDPRILGGTEVPDGKYPFMAYIEIEMSGGSLGACGGTLIDQDSVLTAAHCLENAANVNLVVGRTVLSNQNQGEIRSVPDAFIHPRYNAQRNSAYDAAVLTLDSAVTGIEPIELATASQNNLERPGGNLTAAGWGATSEGGNSSDRMLEVSLPVVSDAEARRAYSLPEAPNLRYIPKLMVAAGVEAKDTCQGDSGGPLFEPGTTSTQVGIVSYGLGCGRAGYPGVYTEVNNRQISRFIVNAASS
jgi:secreted trypsin-like serine protease